MYHKRNRNDKMSANFGIIRMNKMSETSTDPALAEKYRKVIMRDDPYKLEKIYREFGFPQYKDGLDYNYDDNICDDDDFVKNLLIKHNSLKCMMWMYKEGILP